MPLHSSLRISVAAIRRSMVLQRMLSSAKPTPKSSSVGKLWPQNNNEQQKSIAVVVKLWPIG